MPVNKPCAEYDAASVKWQRIRDCAAGRDAVLGRGATYVPDNAGMGAQENQNYRARGSFYNAVSRTAQGMNGMIFQKPPTLEDVKDSDRELLFEDMTLDDVDLEAFARRVGNEVVLVSRYGVLVDMPPEPTIPGEPPARPYCQGYMAENIINWSTSKRNGKEVLNFLVLRECEYEFKADDPFTLVEVVQYRELRILEDIYVVQLWRQDDKDKEKFVPFGGPIVPKRRGAPLNFIPFQFIGSVTTSAHIEDPMLADLADVNLAHWRNSVDYEYGMHLTALPTPWVSGLRNGVMPPPAGFTPSSDAPPAPLLKLGPGVIWELTENGSAGMLEFSGTGLSTIKVAMDDKKKQMATLGARLMEDQPAQSETAEAVRLRHSGESASLTTTAQSLERGLTHVVKVMLWWMGTEATPQDVSAEVEVNKEFLNIKADPGVIAQALALLQAEKISYETFYTILREGGWARENISAEEEVKAIEEELAKKPAKKPESTAPPQAPPGKKVRTVKGADGQVKYVIEDEEVAAVA